MARARTAAGRRRRAAPRRARPAAARGAAPAGRCARRGTRSSRCRCAAAAEQRAASSSPATTARPAADSSEPTVRTISRASRSSTVDRRGRVLGTPITPSSIFARSASISPRSRSRATARVSAWPGDRHRARRHHAPVDAQAQRRLAVPDVHQQPRAGQRRRRTTGSRARGPRPRRCAATRPASRERLEQQRRPRCAAPSVATPRCGSSPRPRSPSRRSSRRASKGTCAFDLEGHRRRAILRRSRKGNSSRRVEMRSPASAHHHVVARQVVELHEVAQLAADAGRRVVERAAWRSCTTSSSRSVWRSSTAFTAWLPMSSPRIALMASTAPQRTRQARILGLSASLRSTTASTVRLTSPP